MTDLNSLSSRLAKIGFVHKKTKLKHEKRLANTGAVPTVALTPSVSTPTGRKPKAKAFTPYAQLENSCGGNLGRVFTDKKKIKCATTEEPLAPGGAVDMQKAGTMKKTKKKKKRFFGTERSISNNTNARTLSNSNKVGKTKLTEEQVKETF